MNSTSAYHLLVIEDDQLVIDSLRIVLPKNWRLTAYKQLPTLAQTSAQMFHAAFVDMHLQGDTSYAEGPGIIGKICERHPSIEVIAMSGDLSLDLMEACLKNGATKFLAKPLHPDEVLGTLEKIEALWQMRSLESRGSGTQIQWIGKSQISENVRRQLASLRGEPGPILIEGETGSGKEVAFRLLNQQEPNRPTVVVNIASIPDTLFESELYGHVKGAFTGADSNKVGLAEAAHGGDLFLDEIEALPLSQQVKLLRFLESGEIRKVGAKESTMVKVRVIVASNENLAQLVKEEKFREDLLFRLSGKKINLPPLRQRTEDIPDLAKFFLQKERPRTNKFFSDEAIKALQSYTWPGNVRELKRICEQLCLLAPLPVIRPADVQNLIQPAQATAVDNTRAIDLQLGLNRLLDNYEAEIIRLSLSTYPDIEKASEVLQISRSSLYQKIKNHKLQE